MALRADLRVRPRNRAVNSISTSLCTGMRFALLEAKLALAEMLLKFKLLPGRDTPVPLKFASGPKAKPAKPIMLRVERRN